MARFLQCMTGGTARTGSQGIRRMCHNGANKNTGGRALLLPRLVKNLANAPKSRHPQARREAAGSTISTMYDEGNCSCRLAEHSQNVPQRCEQNCKREWYCPSPCRSRSRQTRQTVGIRNRGGRQRAARFLQCTPGGTARAGSQRIHRMCRNGASKNTSGRGSASPLLGQDLSKSAKRLASVSAAAV